MRCLHYINFDVPSRTVNYVGILKYYPVSIHNIMKLQMSTAWLTLILNKL